ncbi:MAG: hypothetical protein L0241_31600, partial [Planctomycetia bacterium]|nr:hypothetical protein [Planctomycetia bacterium]
IEDRLPIDELQPKKPVPAPQFPQVGTIIALDGRTGTIEYSVVVPRALRTIIPDGPEFQVKVIGWQYERVIRTAKLDRLQITDATGKRLTTEEVWKRLRIGTNFFVSADGNPVSAEHLKLIAPDVLVVVDRDNVLLERLIDQLRDSGAEPGWELK